MIQARRTRRATLPLVALSVMTGCGSGDGAPRKDPTAVTTTMPTGAPLSAPAPVQVITGATFDWASHRRFAEGSDNWPVTWSDDDHQYAVWGDGGGFGGAERTGRASLGVARIEGDRDNYRGVNRFGGLNRECASRIHGKGHGAPLSIGGILYVWITPGSGSEEFRSFTLHKSVDKGCTWKRLDVVFERATENVALGSFVQFGRDNTLARDAYLYTVATEVSNPETLVEVQLSGRVMLLRVPAASIEDRGAFEYFAGLDATGQPTWSADPAKKLPIYEDRAGVGPFAQMSYVPGLDRLVYTNQHGDGMTADGFQSLLTMAEAPDPWGPWNIVFKDVFFPTIERTVFQWNFAPKWFSSDGRQFTLIFSGTESNDSWNTVNGTFLTQ
jgi:hypothetical protein